MWETLAWKNVRFLFTPVFILIKNIRLSLGQFHQPHNLLGVPKADLVATLHAQKAHPTSVPLLFLRFHLSLFLMSIISHTS